MCGLEGFGEVLLYVGLALALVAAALYVGTGLRTVRGAQPSG
jgi:hypothetical protein